MKESFATYLRRKRLEQKMTQQDLVEASRGDFKQSYVSALERGVITDPSPFYLNAIAKALGAPPAEVYEAAGRKFAGDDEENEADKQTDPIEYVLDDDERMVIRYLRGIPQELRGTAVDSVRNIKTAADYLRESQRKRTIGRRVSDDDDDNGNDDEEGSD